MTCPLADEPLVVDRVPLLAHHFSLQILLFSATFSDKVKQFALNVVPKANQVSFWSCCIRKCVFCIASPLYFYLLVGTGLLVKVDHMRFLLSFASHPCMSGHNSPTIAVPFFDQRGIERSQLARSVIPPAGVCHMYVLSLLVKCRCIMIAE
jgi:hypothetical protein